MSGRPSEWEALAPADTEVVVRVRPLRGTAPRLLVDDGRASLFAHGVPLYHCDPYTLAASSSLVWPDWIPGR